VKIKVWRTSVRSLHKLILLRWVKPPGWRKEESRILGHEGSLAARRANSVEVAQTVEPHFERAYAQNPSAGHKRLVYEALKLLQGDEGYELYESLMTERHARSFLKKSAWR
jgi:hypothetical protein